MMIVSIPVYHDCHHTTVCSLTHKMLIVVVDPGSSDVRHSADVVSVVCECGNEFSADYDIHLTLDKLLPVNLVYLWFNDCLPKL